jgi:hypothetical protein
MKPGDLIEWVYISNSQPVDVNEKLWSTPMNRWIPIGVHPAVLISITDEFYVWLTPEGLFRACVDNTGTLSERMDLWMVVPRARGWHVVVTLACG